MIRLFKIRTLVLLIGEALIVWTAFLLGAVLVLQDSYLALNDRHGYYKIIGLTVVVLLCSHGLDLYDTARLNTKGEMYLRLLKLPTVMAFILAGVAWVKPDLLLVGESSTVGPLTIGPLTVGPSTVGPLTVGLIILTFALFGWRIA